MTSTWHQPKRFRLTRGLVERLGVRSRYDRILLALNDQHRSGRDLRNRLDRPVLVVNREGERPLQRPGEPCSTEDLSGDAPVAGECPLDDQGADLSFVGRAARAVIATEPPRL